MPQGAGVTLVGAAGEAVLGDVREKISGYVGDPLVPVGLKLLDLLEELLMGVGAVAAWMSAEEERRGAGMRGGRVGEG